MGAWLQRGSTVAQGVRVELWLVFICFGALHGQPFPCRTRPSILFSARSTRCLREAVWALVDPIPEDDESLKLPSFSKNPSPGHWFGSRGNAQRFGVGFKDSSRVLLVIWRPENMFDGVNVVRQRRRTP